ncbi:MULTISPECIES: DUF6296 family protein [Kitasatospora]|uniref:Uncharacterized protein n=2 Tax=Kitasatospora TaxID=2063 RepID=A0ABT1J1Y2_9ACTN|nr:DUF6296 family protein [Kitasatospora paracochleata]MCP2311438.1 hypothetical protein [Kitasatospora paracochleata]
MATTVPVTGSGYLLWVRLGDGAAPLRVPVAPTGTAGPAGYPVFRDPEGRLTVEIAPDGRCRLLARRGLLPAAIHAFAADDFAPTV